MRVFATTALGLILLLATACGGGKAPASATIASPMNGNWQLNLLQEYPVPATPLSASGFFTQTDNSFTGSVQGPLILGSGGSDNCDGTAEVTGTISGQSVAFTENLGGTTYNFSGTISSDKQSMSGDFNASGGACLTQPTTGTWNAFLIPPLNGTFTGTFLSNYMEALTGSMDPVPVSVSGTFTQGPNTGSSTATLTGTITSANGYPCFTSASMTGTITGQTIYLSLYGYNGLQIGTLGELDQTPPSPAILTVTSSGFVMTSSSTSSGFFINIGNPCPAVIARGGETQTTDLGGFTLNIE